MTIHRTITVVLAPRALNNARNVQDDPGRDVQRHLDVKTGVTHLMKRPREGWAYIARKRSPSPLSEINTGGRFRAHHAR